jgi:signal transduction histidine kinase
MLSQNPVVPTTSGNILAFPSRSGMPALPFATASAPGSSASGPSVFGAVPLAGPLPAIASPVLPALDPTAALAHDARNALTTLVMIAGLLGEPGLLPPQHRHYAADLERTTTALGTMIEKLAGNLAQDAKPGPPTASRGASAGDALASCAGVLHAVAGPMVNVNISSETRLPPLGIDDDALLRVLTNLVKNASEAMPKGGAVRITARRALSRTAPAVLVHISDNGPGIPAYALGRIFEPGFSSKQSAGPEPCGLGLAIVRELVEAAGGSIEVATTRRRGTTFELRLPCLREQA